MRIYLFAVLVITLALPMGLGAAKRPRLDSQWRTRDITIDGDSGDWPGPLVSIDDKHPITAGVANDAHFLYLVLTTSDSTVRRQVLRQGLIVWFDPGGGDKKHFGIKFPVGFTPDMAGGRGRGRRPYGSGGGGGQTGDPGEGGGPPPPDQMEPPARLEVYGPEKGDVHNYTIDMAPGISVKLGQAEGYLVYELKVPLAKSSEMPYAIEAKPGAAIGFGIETPKLEMPSREGRGGMGGMGGMGGRRGGGGMGGRGGGGMGGGRRGAFEDMQPWKTWATVQLAAH